MRRGDGHGLRIPGATGPEQRRDRFDVIVQSDGLLHRSAVLVAPTSRSARPASFRPEVVIEGEPTLVLVEQVEAVDAGRLTELVSHVDPAEMWGIDEALLTVLDLR